MCQRRRETTMNIKTLSTAVACALALGVAGTAWGETAKLNLNSQPNEAGFPMWLANDLGYFSDNGLEVEIEYFPNGGAALATGATGQWQAGWTGGPPDPRRTRSRPSRRTRGNCDGTT